MKTAGISHPLLSDIRSALGSDALARLDGLLGRRDIQAGEVVFKEGEKAEEMFFILSGSVAVHKQSGFGGKTKVVALLEAGSVAAESVIAGVEKHGADVVAVTDCRLLVLSRSDLELLEQELPDLFILLLKNMFKISSLRLQKSSERLALIL